MAKTCVKVKEKVTTKVHHVGFKTCELYKCMRCLMRLTRWFGLFPVEGMDSTSISRLRFNVKSVYSLYLLFSCIGLLSLTILSVWGLVTSEFSLATMSRAVFFLVNFSLMVMLIILAKLWPGLMKEIAQMESEVKLKLDNRTPANMSRLNIYLLVSGFVEHILCYIYVLNFTIKCLQTSITDPKVISMMITLKIAFLMDRTNPEPYHYYTGVIFELTTTQTIFIWNLVDAIVISHCMYLTNYFKAFNKQIQVEIYNDTANWGQLRTQHARLVILVKKINAYLSYFVLMSFFSNLFFTIFQLFNALSVPKYHFGMCSYDGAIEAVTGKVRTIFYVYSFSYLAVRTVLVSLMAANVNRYACLPISALGEVQASMYDSEIQRFYRQIKYTTIGVSGVFFYVTREMILKVLGTLITYELILLQFTDISMERHRGNTTTNQLDKLLWSSH